MKRQFSISIVIVAIIGSFSPVLAEATSTDKKERFLKGCLKTLPDKTAACNCAYDGSHALLTNKQLDLQIAHLENDIKTKEKILSDPSFDQNAYNLQAGKWMKMTLACMKANK